MILEPSPSSSWNPEGPSADPPSLPPHLSRAEGLRSSSSVMPTLPSPPWAAAGPSSAVFPYVSTPARHLSGPAGTRRGARGQGTLADLDPGSTCRQADLVGTWLPPERRR